MSWNEKMPSDEGIFFELIPVFKTRYRLLQISDIKTSG